MRPHRPGFFAAVSLLAVLGVLVFRALRAPPGESPAGEPGPASALFGTGPAEERPAPAEDASIRGPSIRGVVVDGDGIPIEGAEVAAAREGERVPSRVLTGVDGRFELPAGSAADGCLVGARAPGKAPVLRGGVRPGDGELRLVLLPGARLEGRVKDPAGLPLAGARVRATLRFPGVTKDLGGFETRADESGRYGFDGLPAVEGIVQASFHDSSSGPVSFTLRPGEGSVERDLQVETGPSLEGVVRGADGTPLAGIVVSAKDRRTGRASSASSGEDGRFAIRALEPVAHDLGAVDPRALWLTASPRPATPPERSIELVMVPNPEPPAYATFRVLDAEGGAVRAVRTLEFRDGEKGPTGSGSLGADESGIFRTGRLRPGRRRIDLRCPAGTGTTGPFTAEAGQTADLGTVRLSPAATLKGRLLDPAGAPAAKARLFIDDDALPEPGAVAADGSFELRGLPAGSGRVRALLAGCAVLAVPWRAAAGETADLGDLRLLPATGAFRGSVRSRSGAPVAGARIRISPWDDFGPSSDGRRILAGADGRFEAPALAAGRWVLSASPPKGKNTDGKVAEDPAESSFTSDGKARRLDLGEGEQVEVDLEID